MAKRRAGAKLTKDEQGRAAQLEMFAITGEEP